MSTNDSFFHSEIVLGLTYAIGTSADKIVHALGSYLESEFGYSLNQIRLSEEFDQFLPDQNLNPPKAYDKRRKLMDAGNQLRQQANDNGLLSQIAASLIAQGRIVDGDPTPRPRTVHLVRSLKRPEEVAALREVYGSGFYAIGVYAAERDRLKNLRDVERIDEDQARQLLDDDQSEDGDWGQQTGSTFELSDVFVAEDEVPELHRFLNLLFGKPVEPPTRHEHAMSLAYVASCKSATLARQVGASIVSECGDVIAVGCNDVPKYGGGLYCGERKEDYRDHNYETNADTNTKEMASIIDEISTIVEEKLSCDPEAAEDIKRAIRKGKIRQITEFGRSVHAEMDALLNCARQGVSPRNGILYTTTFPCHNCAKHIVAAGIRKVVFIEPYPKSKASDLHRDSIELVHEHEANTLYRDRERVEFVHFLGVGPRRYVDLFSMKLSSGKELERKDNHGNLSEWDRDCGPRIPMPPDSYLEREQLCAKRILDWTKSLESRGSA